MIQHQRRLIVRTTNWFQGSKAVLARGLRKAPKHPGPVPVLGAWQEANAHRSGFDLVEGVLDQLGVRYTVDQVERSRIPQSGRLLLVVDRSFGLMGPLALLHLLGEIRRDVRILGDPLLAGFEGLRGLLLPMPLVDGRLGESTFDAVVAALEAEQAVLVFPADSRATPAWRTQYARLQAAGFAPLAVRAGAAVLPVRARVQGSAWWAGLPVLRQCLRHWSAAGLRQSDGLRVNLRIGHPRPVEALTLDRETRPVLDSIRQALQAIGTRKENTPSGAVPLVHAVDRSALRAEVLGFRELGSTPDGKQIRLGRLASDSLLLRELGRVRELSFRAVGEGTGRALDVDAYDTWYEHIVLWDAESLEIAGAYRVCRGSEVLPTRGVSGLYTSSLFEFGPQALSHAEQGLELGRSFVVPKYWGTRSLDYLWLGIGAYLRAHPEVRYLFGPVSISAELPIAAREQLVAYYQQQHGGSSDVRARQPFHFLADPPCYRGLDDGRAARLLKARLDAFGVRVPMLYKQYTELCPPGGARFLAFGVDPGFAHCVDGLIEVDLHRLKPRKFMRYIGDDSGLPPEVAA